jgi:transcriptional regulator with XRE-family HTH domain
LNVTIQQIRKYEAAKNRISSGNLFYLAQALKVPISYFFGLYLEREPELWINEEKILTIRGGGINIKVNGMQLNNLSKR